MGYVSLPIHAGEIPSRAFSFNSNGLAFTMNAVRPVNDEIDPGTSLKLPALKRIRSAEISLGHNYNVIDVKARRIASVETASKFRVSVHEIINENSTSRKRRADVVPKESKDDFLWVLGDTDNKKFPIYMTGPKLYTMCSVLIDLDEQTLTIFQGNPKNKEITHVFSLPKKQS